MAQVPSVDRPVIFSIGHSTHAADAFAALLRRHDIRLLADIRTVPRSGRHPHFNGAALADRLAADGVVYRHFAALGGLRSPRPDSANTGWLHPSFRGYADHMQCDAFKIAVDELLSCPERPAAVMCAEGLWWQCHRRLLADALVARGVHVLHIHPSGAVQPHELTPFGRVGAAGDMIYPGLL